MFAKYMYEDTRVKQYIVSNQSTRQYTVWDSFHSGMLYGVKEIMLPSTIPLAYTKKGCTPV